MIAFAAVLAGAAFGVAVSASGGRIPIYQAGTAISQPGSYYLTQDLDGSSYGGDVISVQADGVTLDLNGHTVTASATHNGISIAGVTSIRVTNGRFAGGQDGVYMSAPSGTGTIRLDHLDFSGQTNYAIYLAGSGSNSAWVDQCSIDCQSLGFSNYHAGIYLTKLEGCRIVRDVLTSVDSYGIWLSSSVTGAIVRRNTLTGNYYNNSVLIQVDGNGNTIDWNMITNAPTELGISGAGNVYAYNHSYSGSYSIVSGNTDGGGNH